MVVENDDDAEFEQSEFNAIDCNDDVNDYDDEEEDDDKFDEYQS